MAFLDALLRGAGAERRAVSGVSNPASWLLELLGPDGAETYSGKAVSVATATELVPVFSATSLLAGGVGSLPLITYRRQSGEGRERAGNHRMYRLLHDRPNELMAADELWEVVTAHLVLWGNSFLAKGRGDDGLVNELVPLSPDRVKVGTDRDGAPMYIYTDTVTGREIRAGVGDVLHIRGLSFDGRVGISPIQAARQMIGNELARTHFQGAFWKNNARPGGILTHPSELSDKAERRLRKSWEAIQGGLANAGKTAILEEGMEWQALGLPLADAQFIEQAKFARSDIALLFRVPPHMLAAEIGSSMTYNTVEGQSLDFVRWSLRRWLTRIEGALKRDAAIFPQGGKFYAEFLVDALLRADSKTRGDFYAKALDPVRGWLVTDEVRAMENRNPLTDEQLAARAELAKLAKSADSKDTTGGNDDGGDDPQGDTTP